MYDKEEYKEALRMLRGLCPAREDYMGTLKIEDIVGTLPWKVLEEWVRDIGYRENRDESKSVHTKIRGRFKMVDCGNTGFRWEMVIPVETLIK